MEIIWDDEKYSIGNEVIDQQHLQIVNMINTLIRESEILDVHSETLHDALSQMLQYAQNHLTYEESILKQIGCHNLKEHIQLHCDYLEMVSNLSMDALRGNQSVPVELITYLRRWWNNHILIEDMKYKPCL